VPNAVEHRVDVGDLSSALKSNGERRLAFSTVISHNRHNINDARIRTAGKVGECCVTNGSEDRCLNVWMGQGGWQCHWLSFRCSRIPNANSHSCEQLTVTKQCVEYLCFESRRPSIVLPRFANPQDCCITCGNHDRI
jgi:hypothetical protein